MRGLVITWVFLLAHVQVIYGQCYGTRYISLTYSSNSQNGSISSPGYPYSRYESNVDCSWRIAAPYNQRIMIYFLSIDLETNCCGCDYVKIYDGSSSYYTLLTKGCGTQFPAPVYSSGRYIYIRLVSDGSIQGRGFRLKYKTLVNTSFPSCPSIFSGDSAGVIYSPNFPWQYENNEYCSWTITAFSWERVLLNFTQFDLESSCSDYVEVQGSNYFRRFCGNAIPSMITTTGSLTVTFRSDYSVVRTGFLAIYRKNVQPTTSWPTVSVWTPHTWTLPRSSTPDTRYGACEPGSYTSLFVSSSGSLSIASPYDHSYYTSCFWRVETKEGYILELSFDSLHLSSSCSSCSCGSVKIRDGISSSDPLLGTYCNNYSPGPVSTTGNQMWIKYSSGSSYSSYSSGNFRATVRSTKASRKIVVAVVIPIVVAIVLFVVIFVVIKCTKITRSARPAGLSSASEVPLQTILQSDAAPPAGDAPVM